MSGQMQSEGKKKSSEPKSSVDLLLGSDVDARHGYDDR